MKRNWMKALWGEIKNIAREYRADDGINLAAALSFYAILSILPIFLIVIALAGHYLGDEEILLQKAAGLVESVLPALKPVFLGNLQTLLGQKSAIGWLGILFLFFVAHFLFANLERTVNRLLHSKNKRHFLITRLLFLGWLSGIVFLLSVPSLINLAQAVVAHWGLTFDFDFALSANQMFFLVAWMSFVMLMVLVPTHKIRLGPALAGGLIFALLLEGARWLFRLYTSYYLTRYNLIYGSLTVLILGALWIFYFSNILLVCILWVGQRQKRIERVLGKGDRS